MLDDLVNRLLGGGCDDCGACQTLTTDGAGIYVLTVEHEHSCPYLAGVTR